MSSAIHVPNDDGHHSSSELLRTSIGSGSSSNKAKNKTHQPVTAFSSRSSAAIEELNRLKFASRGIYGREEELRVLKATFEVLQLSSGSCDASDDLNLVLVGGKSGTGKTALVKEFGKTLRDPSVMFVHGTYDQYLSLPYGAFIAAFSQLCSEVRSHPLYESKIRAAIVDAVGQDHALLVDLIPNLGELLFEAGAGAGAGHSHSTEDYDIVKSKEKFKFLIQRFLQAVCQPGHRVVLFLDDVQWMDPASERLLELIMTVNDATLAKSLMVVCTYRNDEVQQDHVLFQLLRRIQERRGKSPTTITLQNLPLETIVSFLADLLSRDPSEVEALAKLAYERCDGNIFFLVQFVTALRDSGHLTFSIASMKWTWNDEDVKRGTMVARNVLAVLMDKIRNLPEDAKVVLQVVACLGASFDEHLVALIVSHLQPTGLLAGRDMAEIRPTEEILASLQHEGILEAFAGRRGLSYCYSHSQIGFASHELIEADFMAQLKLGIGRILYEHKSEIDFHALLFTIVDLWNAGRDLVSGSHDTKILLELNYQAGKKALESFAFGASADLLQNAIDLIPQEKRWTEEYDLSLSLYTAIIKAEHSNGNFDDCRQHVEEVLSLLDRPVLDKIGAYTAMITILTNHEKKATEALDLAVFVLGKLGADFKGVGKVAVLVSLIKTKRLLRKVPLERLLTQAQLTDKNKIVALDICSTMSSAMYAANPDLMMCTVLKTLRWSLKYGVSRDTAKCISFFGVVEMALGNLEAASKACQLAVDLAEKQNLMQTEFSPASAAYGFVLPWTNPLHTCSNHLLSAYNIGLETGDLHYSFMNITLFCSFAYFSGKPLRGLEADMREFARQMKEYHQTLQLSFLVLTWQTVLNLMGISQGDPVVLSGEVMAFDEMLQQADKTKNPPLRAQTQCHRLQLSVYFRRFDLAATLICPAGVVAMVNPGSPIIWRNALFEGIAAFELVRQGKRKWKRTALKALTKTKQWVDAGNVNCVHILYMLQAEKAAMEKNIEQARQLFDKAIVTAARNGYRNDRALATERCSEMYASLQGDQEEYFYKEYFKQAKEAYREIEFFGKVEDMEVSSRGRQQSALASFEMLHLVEESTSNPEKSGDNTTMSDLTSLSNFHNM